MEVPGAIRRWLAPPRFDDEPRTRQAAVLHVVLLSILATMAGLIAVSTVQPNSTPTSVAVVYTPLIVVHLVTLVLLRHGHVRAAGLLYIGVIWLVVTGVIWSFGGMTAQNAGGYLVLTVVAGFVLGGRWILVVAGLSIVAAGGMVWAETANLLPEPWIRLGPLDAWIGFTANLVMAGFLVRLGLGRLEDATERAQHGERALRETVQTLRASQAAQETRALQGLALARLAQEVLRLSDLKVVCERAVALLSELLDAAHVAILERDRGGFTRPLCERGGTGWPEPVPDAVLAPLADVLDGKRGSCRLGEGSERPPLVLDGRPLPGAVAAGIPGRERVHGLLVVAGREGRPPGAEDTAFVETVAGLLGAALEHEQADDRLRHAQKMEVVGQLAGGVAHDFNNLLTSILSSAELAARTLPPDRPEHPLLDEVRAAGELAALLTRQLLAFSRRQMLRTERLRLDEVVGRLEALLRRLIGDSVAVRAELGAADAGVECDRGNLEQVVLNLALNARDAVEPGGALRIATRTQTLHTVPADLLLEPGEYVVLTVHDDGRGMSDDVRRHIFEPFFTTKEPSQGTGLGLFTVHGIVTAAGGDVRVESSPGEGTRFEVFLPRVALEPASGEAERPSAGACVPHGVLLLVEDDARVRRIARRILEGAGHRVEEAADGEEALARFDAGLDPLLVVTDLVMPRLGGTELAAALAARGYAGPLLFTSGYAPDPGELARATQGRVALVTKPFTPSGLLERVHELLEAPDDDAGRPT